MKRISLRPLIFFITGCVLFSASLPTSASQTISRSKAEARKGSTLALNSSPERINFHFNDIKAWVNAEGDWYIQGYINHNKLLCANYDLGVRFGIGNPGCTNVEWIQEEQYVSNIKQCNHARMGHGGGELDITLKNNFKRITCAERIIKCTGKCR